MPELNGQISSRWLLVPCTLRQFSYRCLNLTGKSPLDGYLFPVRYVNSPIDARTHRANLLSMATVLCPKWIRRVAESPEGACLARRRSPASHPNIQVLPLPFNGYATVTSYARRPPTVAVTQMGPGPQVSP
jgi:hypothetical protein